MVGMRVGEKTRTLASKFLAAGCACGIPQMGIDMLLAAEAHTGPGHKINFQSSWEKVGSHLALHLFEAIHEADRIREVVTMQDRFLRKHRRQLPGRCYWVVISGAFKRDEAAAKHYAMEELRHCIYTGHGGIAIF